MKYLYIILALLLITSGYVGFTQYYSKSQKETEVVVPSDSYLVPDGTIMPNEGVEEATGNNESNQKDEEAQITNKDDGKQPTVTLDPNARVFKLTGVNYGYDVQEIVVKEGDTVTINFESTDGFHDLVIDEFAIATKRVQPGVKTSVTFVADKKGTFEYYCSVGSHRTSGMVGKIIVE